MRTRSLLVIGSLIGLALPFVAAADPVDDATETFEFTPNMQPVGYSARVVPPSGPGSGLFNSDLAFWGRKAYQGTYEGFRIVNIKKPGKPRELVNFTGCPGDQGDLIVWKNILVRTWNTPAPAGGAVCGGIATPEGQEGLHVFDVSDPTNPVGLAFVPTPCGSHTATGVPDLENDRLLIYSSSSSGAIACQGIDIVEVPLSDPGAASYLRLELSGLETGLENLVTIDPPSAAAGTYQATGAEFGTPPSEAGIAGDISLVNDGTTPETDACSPLVGFPAGAIALVDRGGCNFTVKAINAQAAGAIAMIVGNNVPTDPITMSGVDPTITIPSVMVSLADATTIKGGLPATATVSENPGELAHACHDTGVILGKAMLAGCAGHHGFTVWSLDPADGGSLEDPMLLYMKEIPGVTIGHSASFSWDGEVLIFGHEPGGGGQAECQATSSEVNRTLFFFAARTGDPLGTLIHPRPQTATENCTWHNYNVVPTDKRRILVSGNYQSGVSVVDFTDPANASEIAFADPAPLSPTTLIGGGDWSTYWYDGRIYESDMTRGLIVWKLRSNAVARAEKLRHLNPQTLEMTL